MLSDSANSKSIDRDLFENMPVVRAVVHFVVPALLSSLITIIYSMADAYFVGMIGDPNQLAALSVAFPLYQYLQGFANLWGIGTNSVVSRALGAKNYKKAISSSQTGFWGGFAFALIVSFGYYFFGEELAVLAGADLQSFIYAKKYIFWTIVLGGLPTVLSVVMCNELRSVGYAREAGLGLSIGGIVNFFLDAILVMGFDGDVEGVAIATFISSCISLLYFYSIYTTHCKNSYIQVSTDMSLFSCGCLFEIITTGLPSAVLSLLGATGNVVQNMLYTKYGNAVMAGWGVVNRICFISIYSTHGIMQGILPLVAYNYAAANYQRVKSTIKVAAKMLLTIAVIVLIASECFPEAIIRMFIDDSSTIQGGAVVMRCYMLATPFMCAVLSVSTLFQAIGKWKHALVLLSMRQLLLNIPLTLLLEHYFYLRGVAMGQFCCDFITTFFAIILFNRKFITKNTTKDLKI